MHSLISLRIFIAAGNDISGATLTIDSKKYILTMSTCSITLYYHII